MDGVDVLSACVKTAKSEDSIALRSCGLSIMGSQFLDGLATFVIPVSPSRPKLLYLQLLAGESR